MIVQNNKSSHLRAAQIVRDGGIVAFRTDTFYGLGVDPLNRDAVRKIRELKGREAAKPILLLISDLTEVDRFIPNRSKRFKAIANRFWPAPLTLVVAARAELPRELTAETETIGVRLPYDEDVRRLVRACGGALTATSANLSASPPARTAEDVATYFPKGIDLIIDGGEVTATQPSTILDLSGPKARLIREGAIPRAILDHVLKD